MSSHLSDLRMALQRSHWCITEMPGNDSNISAVWRVARPNGSQVFHLEFGGIDGLEVRPIEKAYGITVREAPTIGAYFARVERSWPTELEQFLARLEQWATERDSAGDDTRTL